MAAPTSPHGRSGRASVPGTNRPHAGAAAGRATVPGGYGPSGARARSASGTRPAWVGQPGGSEWSDGPGGPGGGGPGGPGGPGQRPYRGGRPQPQWKRIGLVAGIAVLALALIGGGGLWLYTNSLNGDFGRTDAFAELTGGRPDKINGAQNILLVGTDSRDPDAKLDAGSEWRADTIIMMHIPASHDRAYLVSVPRDLYVPVPDSAKADCAGAQRKKINAAFAVGGLPLAVRTMECMTDVRIDNVMAIDFSGFKEVTDALGGVDLKVEKTITSIHKPFRTFKKGTMHMNGAQALDWIRQRKQFADGDFARVRHQQEFLRALMDKAVSTGTLTSASRMNAFLKATTAAVTVDKGFSLVDMAVKFRNLRGDNLQFVTSPNKGSDDVDGESVVVADREKALALYQAMAADKMADWATANVKPAPSAGG
ncbi:MAG TPA: LCP family protein [Catenuloplanes sp.]